MFSLKIITVASTLLLMSSQLTRAVAEPISSPEFDLNSQYSFTLTQEIVPAPTLVYTQTEPDYSSIVLAENDTTALNSAGTSWLNLAPGSICACIVTDTGTPLSPPVVVAGVGPIIPTAIPEPASALLILLGYLGILASRIRFFN